jgi:hypothetical protein
MTTADWALVVSLFSFMVSLAGFVWNIWSKFIYPRAKVRASIAIMLIFDGDGTPPRKFIAMAATNYGPTDITLSGHIAKRRQGFLWFGRNRRFAALNTIAHPDSEEPAGITAPGFPKKLAVGENVSVYLSAQGPKRWVEESDLYWFGFADTFGRNHWCSRANAKKFRADVIEDFGAKEPHRPGWMEVAQKAGLQWWTKVTAKITENVVPTLQRYRRKVRTLMKMRKAKP